MQALVERHGGEVPDTFEELENLAGVGHKTASVVMSVAFQVGPILERSVYVGVRLGRDNEYLCVTAGARSLLLS